MKNLNKDLRDNLINNVILWAREKGILKEEYLFNQILKKDEELGELSKWLFSYNHEEVIDALGDIQVTLIVNAHIRGVKLVDNYVLKEDSRDIQYNYTRLHKAVSNCGQDFVTSYDFAKAFHYINELCNLLKVDSVYCLKVAYDVISKRKTKTIDGRVLKV